MSVRSLNVETSLYQSVKTKFHKSINFFEPEMSTRYRFSKCKYIVFSKSEEEWKSNRKTSCRNVYSLEELKQLDPETTEHFNFVIKTHDENGNSLFPDIKFPKTDEDGMSSKQIKTQDVKKDAMLGAGNNILAFSKQQFTVIVGKNTAGINSIHAKQNHGVVDVIAKNGILTAPKSKNSVKDMFNILSAFKSFDIVVICPYLISYFDGKYPTDYSRPSYIVGKGEISAVIFWYICLYFFGYSSVYDDTNIERNYDI